MLHKYLRCTPEILVIFLFCCVPAFADEVNDNLSDPAVTWSASGNPWVITTAPGATNPLEEVQIGSTTTLTIEPGVIIEIDGPISIRVLGTLIARGTVDNPIIIRPRQATGQWRSIEFSGSATSATFSNGVYQSGSILEYINLESGGGPSLDRPPSNPSAPANGVIYLNGVSPYINNVSITDGEATGIYATAISNELKIHNSNIVDNHDAGGNSSGGIFVEGVTGSNIDIDNNTIQNNSTTTTVEGGGGVLVKDVDVLSFTNNSVLDNVSGNVGGGLFLFNLIGVQANYVVQDNVIGGNITEYSGGGIAIQDSNVIIRDNLVHDNMTNLDFGGGLNVIGNSEVQVEGNAFKDNDAASDGGGIYVNTAAATNINIINNAVTGNNTAGRGSGVFIDKDTITVTGNMIADNTAADPGNIAAIEVNAAGTVSQNSIVRNQSDSIIAFGNPSVAGVLNFTDNNVSQNSSTQYTIASATNTLPVMTGNNVVNNGAGFYLGNTSTIAGTLSANGNWFGTTDQTTLQNNIDGDVDYTTPATAIITDPVPLSPPSNFNITQNGDTVTLTWDAPAETDLAGFIVYWGNSSAPIYGNSQDVGLSQSFTVPGIDSTQNYYFAVTAYDSDIGTVTDDPATLLNEKQLSGHESWFSDEAVVLGVVMNPGGGGGGGGSIAWWSILLLMVLLARRRYTINVSRI